MNGKPRSRAVPGPMRAESVDVPASAPAPDGEVAEFIAKAKAMTPAAAKTGSRLIFALDATMSRQPTWDLAQALQADMFQAVESMGGLTVQLVYFRGAGECRASRWVTHPAVLARLMARISCQGGLTQIGKVLGHAHGEAERHPVAALVYVGDAMEENIDALCARAGALALLGVRGFFFQEGRNPEAEAAFRELARLTKGAYCRFDEGAAQELRSLLSAVAVYAAGGEKALAALAGRKSEGAAQRLLAQMKHG